MSADITAARLQRYFADVTANGRFVGEDVFDELERRAEACAHTLTAQSAAVAFALAMLMGRHSHNVSNRIVRGNEREVLYKHIHQPVSAAITFIERGGTADEAVSLIDNLASVTPNRLRALYPNGRPE